jgi:hypothetical protein
LHRPIGAPAYRVKEVAVPTTDHGRDHESLGEEECLRLLATTRIGRVAYTEAALPAIQPVAYTLGDRAVEIPTRTGSALAVAVRGAVVAFEADSYNDIARAGWNVTVIGPSWVVAAGPSEDPDVCLVVVQLGVIRGWRTTLSMRATDTTKLADDAPA